MTIRQRFADWALGPEKAKLSEAFSLMRRAYDVGKWELPPGELVRQLKEVDPWTLQSLIASQTWDVIGGMGYAGTSAERAYTVTESANLYRYSPLAQWSVWLWTGWGIGDKVRILPADETARPDWDEFWKADRNQIVLSDDKIQELSNWLLVTGNRFLAFFVSTVDGDATIRLIAPSQITSIVANPDDGSEPWFYKRQWTSGSAQKTLYYPDWQLFLDGKADEAWDRLKTDKTVPDNAGRADAVQEADKPGTVVCILHLSFNPKEDPSEAGESGLWGWPLLTVARPWTRAHKQFMEARLTVAEAKAMFVRRKRVSGGSRAVASVINTIGSRLSSTNYTETNPPAAPGSVEVENQAITTSDLPMTTGASDAKSDNEMFTWMALLGAGVFPTSAGLDTSRWATALEMDKAQSMAFERYQIYWSAQWRKVVTIVLGMKERYGGATYKDKSADVSIDAFSLSDFPQVATSIGGLVRDALTPLIQAGALSTDTAAPILAALWRVCLQALSIDQAGDLTGDQAFHIGESQVQAIARAIAERIREGETDWQALAQWALDTLMEGR